MFGSRSRKLELRFYLDLTPKLTPLHFIIPLPVLVNQNVTVGKKISILLLFSALSGGKCICIKAWVRVSEVHPTSLLWVVKHEKLDL